MTFKQAIQKANRLNKKTGKPYYVIHELNFYDEWDYIVTGEYDLDTYFHRVPDSRILHCAE